MSHTFTSLQYPLEKLFEAEHFLGRLLSADEREFQYELNAFLSAGRSVSFVLTKTMAGVTDFADWYARKQDEMRADEEMRFFLELRNISQKQGPVSYISGGHMTAGSLSPTSYRFIASRSADVPASLQGRDIATCCAAHLKKLAMLVHDCAKAFPFHACPGKALTEEGMQALGYSFRDIEAMLGLPVGYCDVGDIPVSERLRILRREFYTLELDEIERMARGDFRRGSAPLAFPVPSDGKSLVDYMAAAMNDRQRKPGSGRELFVRAATQRLADLKDKPDER